MKTKAALLAALAALAANAAQMATENWVSNRLTEATAPIRESVAALNSATQTLNDAVGSVSSNVYTKDETDAKIVELAPAPGNYETVSNRAMSAIQAHQTLKPATNYTDRATNDVLQSALRADAAALSAFASTGAVARAATYGTQTRWTDATGCVWEVTEDFTPWVFGDGIQRTKVTITNLVGRVALTADIHPATNALAASTAAALARKQDALPYPTNAIPYAAIAGAPSGAAAWRVVEVELDMPDSIRFVTNGCVVASFGNGADLNYSRYGWPDGAAMFVRMVGVPQSYAPYCPAQDSALRLVGAADWPTNDFQSVWWRSGTNVWVSVLVEE